MNSDILGVFDSFFFFLGGEDNFHLLKVQNRNIYVGMLKLKSILGEGLRGGAGYTCFFLVNSRCRG